MPEEPTHHHRVPHHHHRCPRNNNDNSSNDNSNDSNNDGNNDGNNGGKDGGNDDSNNNGEDNGEDSREEGMGWSVISHADTPAPRELQELQALTGTPGESVAAWVVNGGGSSFAMVFPPSPSYALPFPALPYVRFPSLPCPMCTSLPCPALRPFFLALFISLGFCRDGWPMGVAIGGGG